MSDHDDDRERLPNDADPTVIVRFRVPGQHQLAKSTEPLKAGTHVVAESERGLRVGTVLGEGSGVSSERVLRVVTQEDRDIMARNTARERDAFTFCLERIEALDLPMKLMSVELAHSGSTATFYFTSADRVDFRALVKDLARRFHTRIEMRQIGVRDAARHTGGTGVCGRELCCSTWLPEFKPISVRMAKDQSLALNHDKLSGLCGRLKCCLQYEQSTYETERKALPKVGKRIITPNGEGRVKDINVLKRLVRVQFSDGHYEEFSADVVSRPADTESAPAAAKVPSSPERAPAVLSENEEEDDEVDSDVAGESEGGGTTMVAAPNAPESAAKKRRRRRKKQKSNPSGSGPAPQ